MKHTNKKGFTIVELVIVIAVIAILAAVLIPTFTNLVKKANESSDIQAVRQMNTVLTAETITDELDKTMDQVIDILVANGYNAAESLKPVSKGYNFYYLVEHRCIALVNENKEVVFPKGLTFPEQEGLAISFEGCGKYIDVVANDVDTAKQAIVGGSEKITLSGEAMEFNFAAQVAAGNKTSVDLGNVILSTSQNASDSSKHYYGFDVWGTLELNNGTINARGVETMAAGAKITIGASTAAVPVFFTVKYRVCCMCLPTGSGASNENSILPELESATVTAFSNSML
jgi:prepilin-type N-terminal cleavage/methylation domain-containing protein